MDSLITFLVLLAISAIGAWLKRRAADSHSGGTDAPQPPPAQRTSWQEELRRVLEGEETPALPRPRPPPVVMAPPPIRPATPPVVVKPVIVRSRPATMVPSRIPVPPAMPSSVEIGAGQLAPLTEARQAYERASQLDKTMSDHIGQVSGQRVLSTSVTRREVSPEIAQVMALFKNPRAARQAVIASIILGKPRSLDEAPAVSW